MGIRRGRALLLVLCAAAWGGPDTGAPAFEDGLRVIQGLLERGRCEDGMKRLKKLLEEHARAPYVLGRRVQVEELARQLAFGAAVPTPDPKELISGELLQWNPRDGTIKVRYSRNNMKDWVQGERTMIHPAAFRGPHSISIKGDSYPGQTSGVLVVCHGDEGSIVVYPGLASTGTHSGIEPGIELSADGKTKQIGQANSSPVEGGRPFTIRVVVSATQVSCYYGGRAIVRGAKRSDHWGNLAFAYMPVDEIVISGKIEPSWIQGKVDEARQKALAEFDRRWRPADDLPGWLFEEAPSTVLDEPDPRDWPVEMDERACEVVERALKLESEGQPLAALKVVDATPEGELPGAVRDYFRGVLLHDLGRHDEAVACCRRVREKDPDFVPSALVEVQALAALGRTDEALDIYRGLLARFPRAADLHAEAALFMGASGRWSDADRLITTALANGARSQNLDVASRIVHKASRGPAWQRSHDYESSHYSVFSDMDSKVCFEASQILEQSYAVFMSRLERAPSTNERFKVFLFSGEAGYQDHILDLLGETVPHSAGLYVPALRQLFIWNLPERADMMKTVRHEGFHQYLHRIMDNPPLWFNEGLAEYFEGAEVVAGKWTTGQPRPDHLALLAKPRPLKEFLFLTSKDFMADAGPSYAQAWAFIRFLLHTSRENRQLFDRFWDAFKRIPSNAEAIREALGDRTIESLDEEFRRNLDGLR